MTCCSEPELVPLTLVPDRAGNGFVPAAAAVAADCTRTLSTPEDALPSEEIWLTTVNPEPVKQAA